MSPATLVLRYGAFAALATFANLAAQRAVLWFGETTLFYVAAVALGTAVGLVSKYLLDKRWIFFDTETGIRAHGRKFTKYAAMGLLTTALFWATETLFWLTWRTDAMRELGAILGLAAGYALKYNLDRRFVFAGGIADAERAR